MKHDSNQQAAIAARSNVVVRAGAGAGKTSVLVGRYLRLVAEDQVPVERILTLTFTRKAAAEMRERIYAELARLAPEDQFVAAQLANFDQAVISTLDSFCAQVARSGCTDFGVPPTFAVDDQALERRCDDLALGFIMDPEPGRRNVIRSLLRLNRFDVLWHDGLAALARDHFLVSRRLDPVAMAVSQRNYLLDQLGTLFRDVRDGTSSIMEIDPEASRCIAGGQQLVLEVDPEKFTGGSIIADIASKAPDSPLPGELAAAVRDTTVLLGRLADLKKNCGSSKKPEVVEYKAGVDLVRSAAGAAAGILSSLVSWHHVAASAQMAFEFQEIVLDAKRETGLLSYHDVSALAISVLESDTELRRHYKNRFKAIMIDEFQDNNEEQKKLLYLLAERLDVSTDGIPGPHDLDPSKLFFVGDEKQSIYRFRGADVSVFKSLSAELGGEDSLITLESNYRSEPGLISFFNSFFSRVFGQPTMEFEAEFAPLKSRDPVAGLVPHVQLWNVAKPPASDFLPVDEAEAFHIARQISDWVKSGSLQVAADGAESGVRPVEFDDIAILMRTTGNQIQVERMLRIFGVPYSSQTARSLFLEAPLGDIHSMLQLVIYPTDRVALAAYLRSPLVGMSDHGVLRVLASGDSIVELEGPAADRLDLDPADGQRLDLARDRLADLRDLADSRRLTDLVFHIWYRLGYGYHLLTRSDLEAYAEHGDYIYELARLYEDRGLAEFLAAIRQNIGRAARPTEINVVGQSAGVSIMTIHKAKGLEFPVVIVANCGSRGRTDTISDAPFYVSRDYGLVFNAASPESSTVREKPVNYIYQVERERASIENEAERRRLLYVAATRAKSHLVFAGHLRGQDTSLMAMIQAPFEAARAELTTSSEVELAAVELAPIESASIHQHETASYDLAALAKSYAVADPKTRRYTRRSFSATDLNAALVAAAADEAPHTSERQADGPRLLVDEPEMSAYSNLFGTLAHYCAQQICTGAGVKEEAWDRLLRDIPGSMLPDTDEVTQQQFLDDAVRLATGFAGSRLWTDLSGSECEFELPFLLAIDQYRVRGKIDLVVPSGDHVLVLDFKTDRIIQPDHYAYQLDLYCRAASAIFDLPAIGLLYHLRSGTKYPMDARFTDEVYLAAIRDLSYPGEFSL